MVHTTHSAGSAQRRLSFVASRGSTTQQAQQQAPPMSTYKTRGGGPCRSGCLQIMFISSPQELTKAPELPWPCSRGRSYGAVRQVWRGGW